MVKLKDVKTSFLRYAFHAISGSRLPSAQQNQLGMNSTVWPQNHNSAAEERGYLPNASGFSKMRLKPRNILRFLLTYTSCALFPHGKYDFVWRYCLDTAPVLPVLQEWLWVAVEGLGVQGMYIRTIFHRSYYCPST